MLLIPSLVALLLLGCKAAPLEQHLLSGAPRSSLLEVPQGWERLDEAEPSAPLKFVLALAIPNADEIERRFWSVSDPQSKDYGHYLSLAEIASLSSASAEAREKVMTWARQESLVTESKGNYISIYTTASRAKELFGCSFYRFQEIASGRTTTRCHANVEYTLPDEVASSITLVSGIHRFPSPMTVRATEPGADTVTPKVIRSLYNIGSAAGKASNNKQAVAQFLNQWYSPDDLQGFFKLFSPTSSGQQATVVGTNTPSRPGVEASLDIEYIMGVGSNIKTEFWSNDVDHENQEDFLAWIMAVSNTTNPPLVFSVSYGDDEDSVSAAWAKQCNQEFMLMGLRGISILFASGDSGVGGSPVLCRHFVPSFPASSPYVTAVGGTVLVQGKESVNGLSGGGFSNYFPRPAYQNAAVQAYFSTEKDLPKSSLYNASGRGYPDVSALSEAFTIYMSGSTIPDVAGTSCASPTFAGVVSLINDLLLQLNRPSLGFLNPLFYNLGAAHSNTFTDMTSGSNPGCGTNGFPATVGWDPSGGWGSPNYGNFAKAINATMPADQ